MVVYKTGNLLVDDADVIVNPVNCVGTMGAGLALAFARRWPDMLPDYEKLCRQKILRPGVVVEHVLPGGQVVALFPTKDHFGDDSRLEYVRDGLESMVTMLTKPAIYKSVAFPKLGCGLGRLKWPDVKALIEAFAERVPDVEVRVYV
jgi:O-acetyl-ADP-ribose deacetylase (regulator of RNase III)